MNEDLTNVIGSFIETELDYIEKSNNEIEKLQQENQQLKDRISKAIEYINDLLLDFYDYECEQLIVGKYMINELLETLKGNNKED